MDVERLPFDQYQRYRLVSDLVLAARGRRGRLRVLDVGGRTALLRRFLPDDRIDLVDMEASDSRGLVLGDGSRLPFRDASFDVVAAFDTLEHVPPARRDAFVAECARVSRGHVFLAGPYQAPRVEAAEETLLAFLRDKLRVHHRYLEEHRAHGLPDRAATEEVLRRAGFAVASVAHGNLDRWLALMCVEFFLDYDPTLRAFAERVYKFYNASLYASDHLPPVYRHVVSAARPGLALPEARDVLGAPGAPPEAMPSLLPLAQELLAFDRDRDALAPEMARLHAVVRSLEDDLRQHDATLATVRLDLEGHRATVKNLEAERARERAGQAATEEALRADLAGHKATVAALRAELEARDRTIAALVREVDVRGEALTATRSELAALRDLRGVLEADLEHHRAELRAHGHALADRAARVDDLHAELTAALERARASEDDLDALRADVARLVATLRSRPQNLWRVVSPRKFGDPA